MIAFIRFAALTSFRSKRVGLEGKSVTQNPREVATKLGSQNDTFFAKGFDDAEVALTDWITYLDEVAHYGPDDPLDPANALKTDANTGFTANGIHRAHRKTTEPIRKIGNSACDKAGFPAFGPRSFRHMLARHAAKTMNQWRNR